MQKQQSEKSLLSVIIGIEPTKERHHQNGGLIKKAVRVGNNEFLINKYRAVWECPLDVYRDTNAISKTEYRAGMWFRRAYYGAVLSQRRDLRPTSHEAATMEPTMHDRLLNEARAALPSDQITVVTGVCGHSQLTYSPHALEKLRKGLGHLAVRWNMAAVEVCDHK
ncbi:MAG: hypothetical protein KGI37_10920 [Alphaproteobacteria bacterium]|nr:hypothetical protein [Alphaproteobacteria bacterium]